MANSTGQPIALAVGEVGDLLRQAPPASAWMGPSELSRCQQLGSRRRQEFVAGRWLLRNLLEREGVIPAGAPVSIGAQGRPVLDGHAAVHLSLSHREGRVLAAVADHPVGVDLERVQPRDVAAMAEMACAPQEQQRLALLDEQAALDGLHELWVVKEAAYKAGLANCPPWAFFRVGIIPADEQPRAVSWRWRDGWVASCAADRPGGCAAAAPWDDAVSESRWATVRDSTASLLNTR